MNQTPLTNMEGRWVHSTKEAFDDLVAMGYMNMSPYNKKMEILEVYSSDNGASDLYAICQILSIGFTDEHSKQAYYHNGHFYDQPYEEFTITEEKVQFPELEDIEWVMVKVEKWYGLAERSIHFMGIDFRLFTKEYNLSNNQKLLAKTLYENSKDFKVTWELKEKIDRRLHKNRPLALAIGRWLITNQSATLTIGYLHAVSEFSFVVEIGGKLSFNDEAELSPFYIIPDQVIEWMHEYEKEQ